MRRLLLPVLLVPCPALVAQVSFVPVGPAPLEPFQKIHLTGKYHAEGADFADLNNDGKQDIVSGPFWYQGPDFQRRHKIYPPVAYPIFGYADKFFAFCRDLNGDGWVDVLTVGFPGRAAHWYENPKVQNTLWKRHLVHATVDMESPSFLDLDRDGRPELICASFGQLGYLKPDSSDPTKVWIFHPISAKLGWSPFSHGLGLGDVNGDGRMDCLTVLGWFEQPLSLVGDPLWKGHAFRFGSGRGGAQMFAYDVDGDGDNDVVTSIDAHGWGLSWFENVKVGGVITFREHVIMPAARTKSGVQFSQLHALALVDMNGDGLLDIVTGKTFWAHLGFDPGATEPAVLYWFRLQRLGGVRFVPQLVDGDSGVGRQVVAGDVNGDGLPDIVVGNKKGTSVFLKSR
ncbi:MAG: FG-GAP repeat domain-containing protein [Planctomycetota bacterium]